MKRTKITIISIIFIIIFFTTFSHVFAIDMYLSSSIDNDGTGENISASVASATEAKNLESGESLESSEEPVLTTGLAPTSSSSSRVISSREAASSNELTTSDIINIILIAVGVVIILLAVAILIRCK